MSVFAGTRQLGAFCTAYTHHPTRQPSQPAFGELSLSISCTEGPSTFPHDKRPTTDAFHLEFAGMHAISLSSTPSLVPVNLVLPSGIPALTGHYLIDMLPRDGVFSGTEIFVAHGYQPIPVSELTDLEPSALLGTSSSPHIKIPTSAVQGITTKPLPTTRPTDARPSREHSRGRRRAPSFD